MSHPSWSSPQRAPHGTCSSEYRAGLLFQKQVQVQKLNCSSWIWGLTNSRTFCSDTLSWALWCCYSTLPGKGGIRTPVIKPETCPVHRPCRFLLLSCQLLFLIKSQQVQPKVFFPCSHWTSVMIGGFCFSVSKGLADMTQNQSSVDDLGCPGALCSKITLQHGF